MATGALASTNQKVRLGLDHVSVANSEIQARRAVQAVACPHGGVLHDYVPFYFCNRSPMLSSIYWSGGAKDVAAQLPIIHLRSTAQAVADAGLPFCFTDGHAIVTRLTRTYHELQDLDKIDWPVIDHWSWKNTPEDQDRKRRKEAEFLIRDTLPWTLIEEIGVMTAEVKAQVEAILASREIDHKPPVRVRRKWYYGA